MTKVLLILLVFQGPGNGYQTEKYPIDSMQVCLESVKNAKIELAQGGDSEGAVALFCTNEE